MSAKFKSFVSRPRLAFAAAALSCLAFADRSNATTATSTFTTQVTVNSTCIVSSGNIDFGPVGVLTANADASSTLTVQCTNTTVYDIGLNAGTGSGASVGTRKMTNGSATVNYSLYTDARAHDGVGQYDRFGCRACDRQRRRAELSGVWPRAAANDPGCRSLYRHHHRHRHVLIASGDGCGPDGDARDVPRGELAFAILLNPARRRGAVPAGNRAMLSHAMPLSALRSRWAVIWSRAIDRDFLLPAGRNDTWLMTSR